PALARRALPVRADAEADVAAHEDVLDEDRRLRRARSRDAVVGGREGANAHVRAAAARARARSGLRARARADGQDGRVVAPLELAVSSRAQEATAGALVQVAAANAGVRDVVDALAKQRDVGRRGAREGRDDLRQAD